MTALQPETFVRYRFLSHVRLSPDALTAAFLVKQADLKENDYQSDIWLCHLPSGRVNQLTSSRKVTAFAWEPDGRHLLFLVKPDSPDKEETQLHQIAVDGGEATPLATLPLRAQSVQTAAGGRLLLSATIDLRRASAGPGESHQAFLDRQEREKEEKDYHVVDEVPFWRNGRGYTNKKRTHLYLHDRETQNNLELTPGPVEVESFDLRGEQLVFAGVEFEHVMPFTNDLYLLDLPNPVVRRLTDGSRSFGQPRLVSHPSADDPGNLVLIVPANDTLRYGLNQNEELVAVHLTDGRLETLTPGWDINPSSSVGSDCRMGPAQSNTTDGERFYFHTTEGDSCYLNTIEPGGPFRRLVDRPGAVESFDVQGDTVVYVAFRGDRLQELYRWDAGQESPEIRLTHLNQEIQLAHPPLPPERLVVRREDGTAVDAWVIRPPSLAAGQRCPGVVEIHGGPRTASSHTYFHEYQVLAGAGLAVIYCNPRGSDGKGDAFADIRGKYGSIDYEDIMAVVDQALARFPFIDPQRLGVTGGSYGGFMTNWIIGHTGRFKAAASQRSISNWISFGYTSDIGYRFMPDQIGATPWEDVDKVWLQSPLRYAHQATTPTLFIHSVEDYRCWLPEGIQMFEALKLHGVESRLVIFEGENHELSRSGKPKHRIRRLQEILNWFVSHLLDAPATPPSDSG